MIRAAIVGLGWWGRTLVNSVQGKSEAIRFVAANARSRQKAEDFCRDKKIPFVDDFKSLLSDKGIDAVVLATPHSLHEQQVKQAAAAGKHVFCEKPFTLTVDSAKSALDAVAKAGIVLAVGFNRRFHPSMDALRTRLRDGRLGTLVACVAEQSALAGPFIPKESWRANESETPAGALTGIGIHLIDGMIDLCGPIAEVHCITTRRAAHVDDTNTVLVRFENGATGTFFCSLSTAANYRMAVYGSKGRAEVTRPSQESFHFQGVPDKPPAQNPPPVPPEIVETPGFDTVRAELEAFAAAIEGSQAFPVTTDQILHGVAVFEAVVQSSQTGKPVKVA